MGYYLEKLFITEQTFGYTVFAIISVLFFITTYLRNFDWKDNFSLWNKTFLQNTKNFRAANNLAFEYEKIGDYEKALNLYSYALTLPAYISPKSAPQQLYARVHNNIGNIYFNTKNYTKAIEEYSIAIKMDPEYSQAYFNLGLLYKTIGDLNKAIYYYQKAIELSPKTAEYYNNLGIVYMLKDDYDEAIKMYTKALEINPSFTQVYSNLEIALRYKQKIKQ
jgi:tetratricopeptide (TPR) repeat protein